MSTISSKSKKKLEISHNNRILLFFNSNRNLDIPTFYSYLRDSAKEDIIDTFLLIFYIRDCRGGKGERQLGKYGFVWLFLNYPKFFIKIMNLIPEYGRWDDLFHLWPKKLELNDIDFLRENYYIKEKIDLKYLKKIQKQIIKLVGNQLISDKENMLKGESVSLCAKWCPSEKSSLNYKYKFAQILCKNMGWSYKKYRKEYLIPLRKYLKIVEVFICNKNWNKIDFNEVPCCAMKKLKNSFKKNIPKNFNEWKKNIPKNFNKKELVPHKIIHDISKINFSHTIYEEKWKKIINKIKKLNILQNTLCVVDVSLSMYSWYYNNKDNINCVPIDISIALGLLISSCTKSIFKNHVITYSLYPEFHLIDDEDNLHQKYTKLKDIIWGGNINLESVFDLILNKAKKNNLNQNNIPERIIIITDMIYEKAELPENRVNFDLIDTKYKEFNYKRPNLIFWSLNDVFNEYPIKIIKNETTLITGFSDQILNSVINFDKFSSYKFMLDIIHSDRYSILLNLLK